MQRISSLDTIIVSGGIYSDYLHYGFPTSLFLSPALVVSANGLPEGSILNALAPSSGAHKVASFANFTWFGGDSTYPYISFGQGGCSFSWSSDYANSYKTRVMIQTRTETGPLNGGIRIWDTGCVQVGYLGNVNDAVDTPTTALLDVNGNIFCNSTTVTSKTIVAKAIASQTSPILECQSSSGSALTLIRADGSLSPAALSDAAAQNNSIYYSTTLSKLVYKDTGGVVRTFYV